LLGNNNNSIVSWLGNNKNTLDWAECSWLIIIIIIIIAGKKALGCRLSKNNNIDTLGLAPVTIVLARLNSLGLARQLFAWQK
jgi:hypothetical protein